MDLQNFYIIVGASVKGTELRSRDLSSLPEKYLVAGTTPMNATVYPHEGFDLKLAQLVRVYPGLGWQGRWEGPLRYASTAWSIQSQSSDLIPVFGGGQNAVAASTFLFEIYARKQEVGRPVDRANELSDMYLPGMDYAAAMAVANRAFDGNHVLKTVVASLLVWDILPPAPREVIECTICKIGFDFWDRVFPILPESRYDKLIAEIIDNDIPLKFEKHNSVRWDSREISIPGNVEYGATYSICFEQLSRNWDHMKAQLSTNAQTD